MSAPDAAFLSDALADCGVPVTPLDQAIYRLRSASGPGGRSAADVEAVCDAAARLERLRVGVDATVRYLRATGGGVIAGTAIEILEDARHGGGL